MLLIIVVCLFVTTLEATNFRAYVPSIPIDKLENIYELVIQNMSPISNRDFCHYELTAQRYASWALEYGCELFSRIVFCKLFWTWKIQIPQGSTTIRWCWNHSNPIPALAEFYTVDPAFHLFEFQQEAIIVVRHIYVISFMSNFFQCKCAGSTSFLLILVFYKKFSSKV